MTFDVGDLVGFSWPSLIEGVYRVVMVKADGELYLHCNACRILYPDEVYCTKASEDVVFKLGEK